MQPEARRSVPIHLLPLPAAAIDSTGRIVEANAAFGALVQRDDVALAGAAADFIIAGNAPIWPQADRRRTASQVAAHLITPDGKRRGVTLAWTALEEGGAVVLVSAAPPSDAAEAERLRLACQAQGASSAQLVRLAQRLEEETLRAQAANTAKSQFLANMSHELRTPLNAIIGFSEVMGSEVFGPLGNSRYAEYCENIHCAAEHLLTLIDDLLDLSTLEFGRLELNETLVSVPEVIKAAQSSLNRVAERSGISVTLDIEPLPLINADARKLRQVMINLLSNALKFTPEGGAVTVRAHWPGALAPLEIAVLDSGIGMDAQELARAMTLFGQVDGTLARRFEGSGLGLPLARELVLLHGGNLDINSRKGRGTVVRLTLPASRIAE